MFITTKYSGYNRHGEQTAAGRFLILMQPKTESTQYPTYATECVCGKTREQHEEEQKTAIPDCPEHGTTARLRKLRELRSLFGAESDVCKAYEAEMDKMFFEKHDRHVAGCPECDAHTAYYSVCRYFRLKHITYPIRGIVRYVRMKQLGHFMMGSATVGKHRLILSGSYGSDGLPDSVPDEVYEAGVELPKELIEQWNTGGGWNDAGSEAPAMREWALATFPRTKADVLKARR